MHSYNQYIYSKERRRFGRQCLFSDRNELMVSVHPSSKMRYNFILHNPIDQSTQLSDQKALSVLDTENITLESRGMYHYEGGWPREVNINDEEQTVRHRKKVERDDSWGIQVSNLLRSAMQVAEQNNAVNIYQEFFIDLPLDLGRDLISRYEARPINIFHDFWLPQRPLKLLEWVPNNQRRFLALHARSVKEPDSVVRQIKSEIDNFGSENAFFMWDAKNPLRPLTVFEAPEVVGLARLCPKDDNFLAGGFRSGKVCVWDARTGNDPLRICSLEAAHREALSAITWVHSKTNTEFYTGSLDGSVKYWDGRELKEPIQELLLDPEPTDRQSRKRAHGVTKLEFEYTIPVRYIIGSDMGHVFICNRKGMTPSETLLANYKLFAGPIRSIERNPFFVKNFLIIGDWCAKIWAEESKGSPITLLIKRKNQIMCGTWSTARCSTFVTGDEAGLVEIWDLLMNHRIPIFSIQFKHSITNVAFRPDGELLMVSLKNGDTHMLELDEAMKLANSKEKALIAAMFEREQTRCKLNEARIEEVKLKRRSTKMEDEEKQRLVESIVDEVELDPDDPEQFVQIIEKDSEFRQALRDFHEMTTKVDKKRKERQFVMERTDFEQYYYDHLHELLHEEASNENAFV